MRPRWHDFQSIADNLRALCTGYPGAAHRHDGLRTWDLVADSVIEQHEDIIECIEQYAQMKRAPKLVADIIESYPDDRRVRIPGDRLQEAREWLSAHSSDDEYMDINYGEEFNVFLVTDKNVAFELKMRFG